MLPPEAEKIQKQVHRKISGAKRLRSGLNLSRLTKRIMLAGIINQLPGLSAAELKEQITLRTAR